MDRIETGDLLLFRRRAWYQPFLSCRTELPITHVAMVVRDPIWVNPSLIGLFYIDIAGPWGAQSSAGPSPAVGRIHMMRPLQEAWGGAHASVDVYVRHATCVRDYWFAQHIRTYCGIASTTTDGICAFLRSLFLSLGYLVRSSTPTRLVPADFGAARDLAWVDHAVSWSDETLLLPQPRSSEEPRSSSLPWRWWGCFRGLTHDAASDSVGLDADATAPLPDPHFLVEESDFSPCYSDTAPLSLHAVHILSPPVLLGPFGFSSRASPPSLPPTLFPGITVVPSPAQFPYALHRSVAYTSPLFPTSVTNQGAPRYEWTQ
jgi:hypothetical protein